MRNLFGSVLAVCLLLPAWPRALGEESPGLARLVPEDVHFHGNFRQTPEARRLMEPSLKALRELARSGIASEIIDLITMEMPPNQKEEVISIIKKVIGIIRTPKWGQLIREEFSVSYRFSLPVPEYIALFRVPPEAAQERLAEFRQAFEGIAGFVPGSLKVIESTLEGASVVKLQPEGVPIGLMAAGKKGILAIATSENLLRSTLLLLDSQDGKGSLAASPRFASAFQDLAGPWNSRAFFDFPAYIGFLRGILDMAAGSAGNDQNAAGAISIARTILDELFLVGPISSTAAARGDKSITEARIPLGQRGGPAEIEKLLQEQEPIQYTRIVPKDAAGFFFTAGLNPTRIYDGVLGLIRARLPAGPGILEEWGRIQSRIRFDLREDLLSWLDGGWGWVCLPETASGPCGGVFIIRLEDAEKARRVIKDAMGKARSFLEKRGQAMDLVEVPGLGEEFREIRIGAFPRCRPILGIREPVLIIATNADALKRVSATFRQEAPGFAESAAFRELGFPNDAVHTVYYTDLRDSFQGLADLTASAGFVLSLFPRMKDTRPLLTLGSILTKVGAFLRAIDLGIDMGDWDIYDREKHEIRSRQVVRMKAPKAEF